MKFLKIEFIIVLLITNCLLHGIDVSGNQSGEWIPENNPYNVTGYIVVPAQEVLTIHPGVEVLFTGMFGINVYGQIIAAGTETDSISFSGLETEWDQIRLDNSGVEHYFSYCRINDAYRGIASVDSPVEIEGCHFRNNENGIFIGAIGNPDPPVVLINNCLIENSLNHGIFIVENSATIVENCEICFSALDQSARGAIQLSNQTSGGENNPVIRNNHLHDNVWQGITAFDITGQGNIAPLIENNLIENNLTGIYLLYASGTVKGNQILNNFVSGNPNSGAGIMIAGNTSDPVVTENELSGNFTGFFFTDGATANLGDLNNFNPDDDGRNNIHDNVDESGNTWSIYSLSTADIMAENNLWDSENFLEIAQTIYDGNDFPGNGIVDFDPVWDGTDTDEVLLPLDHQLVCFPNPFNPLSNSSDDQIRIAYNLPDQSGGRLKIFNIKGEIIKSCELSGSGMINWNGRDAKEHLQPSGIYFCRIETGATIITSKILLIK